MSISNNHYDFKIISDLITINHIKEALCKMKAYTKQKEYTKLNSQTVQCLSRFTKNENEKNMGILCDDTYKKEYQQIQIAATSLNDHIQQYDALKKEETKRKCQIQVIINGNLENFAKEDKLKFKNILAATLGIDSDLVSILEVKEGSIKLTVELPLDSAEKLIDSFERKDTVLIQLKSFFDIKEIKYKNLLLKEIYEKYYPQCESFILKNSGTKEDAADVFQDTLMYVMQRIQSENFDLNVPFGGYIYSLYNRKWIRELKKRKMTHQITKDIGYNQSVSKDDIEAKYRIFEECFQKLPQACRELLAARFAGRRSKEIAQELNIAENRVYQRMFECKEKLKKLIEAHPDYDKLNLKK